jgi:hypothetical protein
MQNILIAGLILGLAYLGLRSFSYTPPAESPT